MNTKQTRAGFEKVEKITEIEDWPHWKDQEWTPQKLHFKYIIIFQAIKLTCNDR